MSSAPPARRRRAASRPTASASDRSPAADRPRHSAAIRRDDHTGQRDPIAADGRVRTDRHLAAAPECVDDRAFGVERVQRLVVADPLDCRGGGRIRPPDLHGDDPLAGRGHAPVGGHERGNPRRLIEAAQAGRGQHNRVHVALIELAQPGIEVAAKRLEPGVRHQHGELRHPAHAARADPWRRPQARDRGLERHARRPAAAARARRADLRVAAPPAPPAPREAGPACPCCCARRGRSSPRAAHPRFP